MILIEATIKYSGVNPATLKLHSNKRFINSEGHHLNEDTIIFIPYDLHHHIYHNMRNGKGMNEINKLAFEYLLKGRYK